jgi:hypothetical protein
MRMIAVLVAASMLIAVSACTSAKSGRHSTSPPTSAAASTSSPSAVVSTGTQSTTVSQSRPVVAGTRQVTLRPVTAAGQPVPGYRVTTETWSPFLCTDGASPSAVSPDIRFCGSSASNTVACWKSAVPSTVLCLRDPFGHALVRITYSGTFAPVAAPAQAAPQGLVLADGTQCQIRSGGAWARLSQHPEWVGWYECSNGSDVYGPKGGDGVDRSAPTWTVEMVDQKSLNATTGASGPISRHDVSVAYYDGTA